MKVKTVLGAKHKPSENWLKLKEILEELAKEEKSKPGGSRPRKRFRKRKAAQMEETSTHVPEKKSKAASNVVGLDCEYVGIGPDGEDDMLARVSLVTPDGEVLLDKYVRPSEKVTDFRTQHSGIRPSLLTQKGSRVASWTAAEPFEKVQAEVSKLMDGRIVVGHALHNDFKLARIILGMSVQSGEHDSVADARTALHLYQLHRRQWEAVRRKKKPRNTKKTKTD